MRNKILLLGLFILLFAGFAFAAPPVVDFTFTPSSPAQGQSITFDPSITTNGTLQNLQWQFDTDGNVNYYPTGSTILDENFNVDFTGWTTVAGSWSIASNLLKSSSVADSVLTHPIVYDNNSVFHVNMRVGVTTEGFHETCWNEPDALEHGGVCQSYDIYLNAGSGLMRFAKGLSEIAVIQSFTLGQIYDVNVFRTADGNWSFYVDGVYKMSVVDTSHDINGTYFKLIYGAGSTGFGNWGYTQVITQTAINSDLNQLHTFTTDGTKTVCLTAGNADGNSTTCHNVSVSHVNAAPAVFVHYPNSSGLIVNGIENVDFNFTDVDFNISSPYDFNLAVHRTDTGASTTIVTNANAYTYCTNMDSNATTKVCLYPYNFSNLASGVNWLADVNVSDGMDKNITHAQFTFQVSPISLTATYSGFGTDSNGMKYVNTLNYDVNYTCYSGGTGILQRFIDSTNDLNQSATCDETSHLISNTYQNPVDGHNFLIHFLLSDPTVGKTASTSDVNFNSDIVNPIADLNNSSSGAGFSPTPGTVNLNLTCTDTVSPVLDYNIFFNSVNIFSGLFADGNTQVLAVDANLSGLTFLGTCTDLAGNVGQDTNSFDSFVNCFQLVDESSGVPLTPTDVNGFGDLVATSYLTSEVFDFKGSLGNSVCFTSVGADTIRFDLNYSDGTQLFREFNQEILLNYDTNVPVCAADAQSFFEQDFTSAKNTPIVLKHQLSHCFNMADYTKYAEADALSARAFTIVGPYIMETFDNDGNKVVLAQINGGTPSSIQVDFLKFKIDSVPLNVVDDYLGISLYLTGGAIDSNTLKFAYVNFKNDNLSTSISVSDNNGEIFSYSEFANPNLFVVYFDHTLVPIDGNILTVTITKNKAAGVQEVETKYFSLQGIIKGAKGIFGSGEAVGVIVAVVIFLFMFTMAAPKYALGWVGILASLISLVILTLTSQAWYVILLQAIFLTIAIYLSIQYKDVHAGVT